MNINMPDELLIFTDEDLEQAERAENPLEQMDFIDELETVYQDANDEIVYQMETAGNK
jgi:hypothetical protein